MSGHLILNALPPGTGFSQIYYRGGIGEAQDPREFILKQPTKRYRAYLLGAYSQSSPDYGKFVDLEAPTPQEAWDSLQAEGKRLVEIYDADGNCWRVGMDGMLQPKLNAPPPMHKFTEGVRDTPADLRHFCLPEAVDPKDFILKNAPRSYTAYFLNWSMKDDTAKVVAPTPAEAFKLANQVEYGRRAASLVDDETGQRFVQNLWGQAILKETQDMDDADIRRELLDVDDMWDGPWHDELVATGFERVKAETWFKTYPFMNGQIVIMAEPHLNVPDEEVLNPTNPVVRLYCEYTNPREGSDYPVQVFQRWVPVPKLKEAMPHVDQAVKTSTSLEQLQKTLEYGFYRLASWWPGPSAVADSLPQFRVALESRGWQFGKLNAIPMVGGGEVQEHVYKKVNKGTVWTLNASLTPQGRLFAFGSGFKVVMENDEPKDVDWPLAEQTQPEGMGVPEFAELVSAATEV